MTTNKFLQRIKLLFKKEITNDFVKNSKTFCMMPWVHLHVTQQGTVTPCCQTPWDKDQAFGNINENSIAHIWNDKPIRAFRKTMMADKPDSRCARCYKKEQAGLISMRQVTNKTYQHKMEWVKQTQRNGYSAHAKPIYWDIRFSNLCNFKCRICGPWSSSKWFSDAKKLGQNVTEKAITYSIENYDDVMDQLKAYSVEVEEIYFAGGEPLLMEEHYDLLNFLDEQQHYQVTLRYNTNFSVLQTDKHNVLELWKKFDKILICASLDGYEKRGELQRKGQHWAGVKHNLQQLRKHVPHAQVLITPTISVFNAFHIIDFHQKWVNEKLIDVSDFWPNVLDNPNYYNIKIFPPKIKEHLKNLYLQHIKWLKKCPTNDSYRLDLLIKEYENTIVYLYDDNWQQHIATFKEKTQALDVLRNENTVATFPELASLLE